jgi:hypothetical protein
VKIYVAVAEALWKKEIENETQFTTKIDDFQSFITTPRPRPFNTNVLFFLQAFKKYLTPCMTKLRVLVLCFPYFSNNFINPP